MNAWEPGAGWPWAIGAILLGWPLTWSVRRLARGFGVDAGFLTVAAVGSAGGLSAAVLAPTPAMLAASVVLLWPLLALGLIDARLQRLPDLLTLPLLLAGLAQAALTEPLCLTDRAVGAAAGYGVLALAAWSYRRFRGREGLGLGDAKLLAAGGAWLGWAALPAALLGAAVLGLSWAVVLATRGRAVGATTPIAFGAPLALAIWLTWLWGMVEFGQLGG